MTRRIRGLIRAVPLFVEFFIWRPLGVLFFPSDSNEPPAMRSYARVERIGSAILMLLLVLPNFLILYGPPLWRDHLDSIFSTGMWFLWTFMFASGWLAWLFSHSKTRFLRRLFADDAERCLQCGYVLRGLPSHHTCPECGTPYDIYDVKQEWLKYLRYLVKSDRRWLKVLRRYP